MQEQKLQITKHRVIAMLNREELEFLDKLGKDALFSTGHKLSYNEILEGLVDFAREIGLSGEGADSLKKLEEKLRDNLRSYIGSLKKKDDV